MAAEADTQEVVVATAEAPVVAVVAATAAEAAVTAVPELEGATADLHVHLVAPSARASVKAAADLQVAAPSATSTSSR